VIRPLDWDTAFFGRRIGVASFAPGEEAAVARTVAEARTDGYVYLVCKPAIEHTSIIRALAEERFYLSDQGLTWAIDTARYQPAHEPAGGGTIVAAVEDDVPVLQEMVRGLFRDSRFYNDPFFSDVEADRLHEEWLKNSVAGVAADGVLWLPGAGFVTLKKRGTTGEIALIGVREDARGRGLGRALLTAAMNWFAAAGLPRVTVRTQVRNYGANNFYRAHGFSLDTADVAFSRIL
jgi:dTDP-4-amino-4,6-dideoxy-D-galactose acyltransferase